jgi:hypothetical protein
MVSLLLTSILAHTQMAYTAEHHGTNINLQYQDSCQMKLTKIDIVVVGKERKSYQEMQSICSWFMNIIRNVN